jgi:hypothetical protein
MSWSPSQLLVWPNSTSNAFPVGAITLPSGRVGAEVERLLGEAAEADAARFPAIELQRNAPPFLL